MADTSVIAAPFPQDRVGAPPSSRAPAPGRRRPGVPTWALLATATAYGVSQLQVWRTMLGWDESIYLSQVSRVAPAAFFSAPRARGITWLAAPLELLSPSIVDLRVYLSVLSALALFLAFRIWFAVTAPFAAVLAALGFAGLWVTRFYGAQLMPNLWVAFGLVAATGGFIRLTNHKSDRVGLVALPLGLAFAALMRPSDAAWAAAALLVLATVVPGWRRIGRLYLLTGIGSILGAAPWVIEAEQRFGGLTARLHQASAIQGGLGPHLGAILQHWQTMDGPLLCRPCAVAGTPPPTTFWWLVIPVAVVVVVLLARATRSPNAVPAALVPVVVGTVVAFPYLFLVGYSAPRFLLPAVAVLSLPVGAALHGLLRAGRGRPALTYLLVAVVVLGLAGQALAQQVVLTRQAATSTSDTRIYPRLAGELTALGVHPPCVINGVRSPQLAFYASCSSRNVGGHDGSISLAGLQQLAGRQPVALVLAPGKKVPGYARHWRRHLLAAAGHARPWIAYLAPGS